MKPPKTEIDALAAVLMTPLSEFISDKEAESHKDPEKLAQTRMFTKAIEAVDRIRGERTYHMVVLRHGHGQATMYTGFGPYSTKSQAEKALEKLGTTMGYTAYAVVPTVNEHWITNLLDRLDAEPESKGDFAVVAEDAAARKRGWKGKLADRSQYVRN